MLTDALCPVTWRARPRSFVGLMTLYESNYIRFGWLAPDPAALGDRSVSRVDGDCPLELTVVGRAPYTTMLELSYLFDTTGGVQRVPRLQLRLYHDARLVEATGLDGPPGHPVLRRIEARLHRGDRGWTRNMLLNKWLEYCAERGHGFAASPA